MTSLIATLIALALVAFLVVACALFNRISAIRVVHEMAAFACPYCSCPMGLKAISDGRDCSPYEELWNLHGEVVHCHPVCRSVKCERCSNCCVIRLNREGEQFGPRLSLVDAEQIARIKEMSPELLGEMKTWLAEQKTRRTKSCS
jgi:hypothetical protein